MIARRRFLQGSGAALAALACGWATAGTPSVKHSGGLPALQAEWAAIARRSGGRLGVALLDAGGRVLAQQRGSERFPMCSTFKFLLAAAVLHGVDAGKVRLDARIPIREADLLAYAPVSKRHVGPQGLSVAELCQAAMIWSDNTAANLLFPLVGGPAGLTAFLRGSGDALTRSDRIEPEMNLFAADDPRDTTTPEAMAGNLRRLLLGDTLTPASRRQLGDWLVDNRTGDARLRAGLPKEWKIGDKTGTSDESSNDIAILWPSGGHAPLLLSAYLHGATVDDAARNAALADVARALARHLPA